MKKLRNIIIVSFIAVAFLSGCNEPSDPNMEVMATGSWQLVDLMVNNQVTDEYSNEFTLNLHEDETCVFIDQDNRGFTGTWTIDEEGTTLQLTPQGEEGEAVTFDVLYLRSDRMGLERTSEGGDIGTTTFTYLLER